MDEDYRNQKTGAPSVWDMLVFQKAYGLALEIHKASQGFPASEQYELANQLRRSSKSICANLAEGRARQQGSSAEFRRYVLIALGSADESQLWLRFAKDLGFIDDKLWRTFDERMREISKMLNGLASKLR